MHFPDDKTDELRHFPSLSVLSLGCWVGPSYDSPAILHGQPLSWKGAEDGCVVGDCPHACQLLPRFGGRVHSNMGTMAVLFCWTGRVVTV